jgi:hypothetical protein
MTLPSVDWWPPGALGAFLIFMVPIGPGKPAGILLGREAGLGPLEILGLYAAKDVLTGLYLEPLLRLIARHGSRFAWARSAGEQITAIATRTHLGSGRLAQAISVGLVALGAGFMTGAAALPCARLPRPLGWLSVILGDLTWFSVMLAAAIGLTSIIPDNRMVFVALLLMALLSRPLTRRLTDPSAASPKASPAE